MTQNKQTAAPKVGFVSLGCPKALVDSEHILTRLRAEGYEISPSYEGSDLVVINTCGFIDAAVEESLDAIGEALAASLQFLQQSSERSNGWGSETTSASQRYAVQVRISAR